MSMADIGPSNGDLLISESSLNNLMAMNLSNKTLEATQAPDRRLSMLQVPKQKSLRKIDTPPIQVNVESSSGTFSGSISIQGSHNDINRNNTAAFTNNAEEVNLNMDHTVKPNDGHTNHSSMPPPANIAPMNHSGHKMNHESQAPERGIARDMSGISAGANTTSSGDGDMSMVSRRSSMSTWLNTVQNFPSLRNLTSLQDIGGSRLRLFSDNSARSLMSDLSENMSALDISLDAYQGNSFRGLSGNAQGNSFRGLGGNGQGNSFRGLNGNTRSNSRRDIFDRTNT